MKNPFCKPPFPYCYAPMADLTDPVFRRVLARLDYRGIHFTEMVSAEGLVRENLRTLRMTSTLETGAPQGIQLFGGKADVMAEAVRRVEGEGRFDFVNINMGCPKRKILQRNGGAYHLKDPEGTARWFATVRKAAQGTLTVKVRLGWEEENILTVARLLQEEGADALIVHFRLKDQPYRLPADWSWAERIKPLLRSPLWGNGDIDSPETARQRLSLGVDGVMIGRGTLREPRIFQSLQEVPLTPWEDLLAIIVEEVEREYSLEKKKRTTRLKALVRFLTSGRVEGRLMRRDLLVCEEYERIKTLFLGLPEGVITGPFLEKDENLC